MKLIIAGSRNVLPPPATIQTEVYRFAQSFDTLVSGGARGVDLAGEAWARTAGWKVEQYLPDYATFGQGAPKFRNRQMACEADALLAFWDGDSPGTANMIAHMTLLNKPVKVVLV